MLAYTGIETVSNLAEEARDPVRYVPASYPARRDRGLRDLLHAAGDCALGTAGKEINGELTTLLAAAAGRGWLRERPCARPRRESRPSGFALDAIKVYVGILAATILFIATNAGVIGASRITYSMASYRQFPDDLPPAAPAVQDSVALARRVRRDRPDPGHPAGQT